MILRCLSFAKSFSHFTPLFSIATFLKHNNHPSSLSIQEDKMAYYSYQKLTINNKLSTILSELQKYTLDRGKKDREAILVRPLMETLGKMDLDSITSKNLKIIMQMLSSLPKLKDSPQGNLFIDNIKERLNKNEDNEENNEKTTGLLIKLYIQSSTDQNKPFSSNITQQLINNLKSSPETDLKSQEICYFFIYLNNLCLTSEKDRLIRLLLLRKVKSNLLTLKLSQLEKYGIILNQLSHYDFLDEQLGIVAQIFKKAQEKIKQFDHQAIQRIFQAKQRLSNKDSLSKFHRSIIRTLLLTLKRRNSAQAHKIFHLVSLAPQKLRIKFQKDNQGFPLEAFLLQYVRINGKTKKHNKAVNLGLQKLIPIWFNDDTIKILQESLIVIKFKAVAAVLYQLSVMKVNVLPLLEFMETEQFPLKETVLMALITYFQAPNKFMKYQQKINEYLAKFDQFQTLFNTIKQCQATNLFKNFDKIFGEKIKTLYSTVNQGLTQPQNVIYLDYLTLSMQQSRKCLNRYYKTVQELPKNIIIQYIDKVSKENISQNIGKLLFLLKSRKQIWTKQYISILVRAGQCLKQNSLKPQEKQRFWLIVASLFENFLFLMKLKGIRFELVNFLTILFRKQNNKYYDALQQGYISNFTLFTTGNIDIFESHQQLYNSLVRLILFFRIFNKKIVESIRKLDEKHFDQLQRQKIKDLINPGHTPKIQKIDQSTLPIFLFNKNLAQVMKAKQKECIEVIKSSSVKQLYRYITCMTYSPRYTYIKLYGIIIDQFSKKVNFQEVTMFPILNSLQRVQLTLKGSCSQLVKKYIDYLLSTNIKIQDYQLAIKLIDIIKRSNMSRELTTNIITKILAQFQEQPQLIIFELLMKILNMGYNFRSQQLQPIIQIIPYKIYSFFWLQPFFSQEAKEKIIHKIIQSSKQNNFLTQYQYIYLKKEYKNMTKQWILTQNFYNYTFIYKFEDDYKNKLLQISKMTNKNIEQLDFFGNQLFKINDTITLLFAQSRIISRQQMLFYKRLMQSFYGMNFKVSIMIGFPRSYEHLHQTVKMASAFSHEQWRDYFLASPEKQIEASESSNSYQENKGNNNDDRLLFKNKGKKSLRKIGRRSNFMKSSTKQ